jgi:hypothetical protein
MRNITAPYAATSSSVWETPLPYVLGGAVFIMALIVFALNDLVCSFGKDSGDAGPSEVNNTRSGQVSESTVESGGINTMMKNSTADYSGPQEEKIIVIMPGDEQPSFIAMPTSVSAK